MSSLVALVAAVLALVVAGAALTFAVRAHNAAYRVGGELARHRHSHALRAEEQRASRHGVQPGPPPAVSDQGPGTEQIMAQRPTLPRPGQIG